MIDPQRSDAIAQAKYELKAAIMRYANLFDISTVVAEPETFDAAELEMDAKLDHLLSLVIERPREEEKAEWPLKENRRTLPESYSASLGSQPLASPSLNDGAHPITKGGK